ncbi:hypothetical protein IAU59_007364 [Kwoniella sp. CBS 9459]
MEKTPGSMVVTDTNPPRFAHTNLESNLALNAHLANTRTKSTNGKMSLRERISSNAQLPENYDHEKNNQATYLFFPIFGAFLLILLSTLSTPIIPGLSIAEINMGVLSGRVSIGAWGWCTKDILGYDDKCSANRAFASSMTPELTALPEPVNSLAGLSEAIRPSYLIANGVMHILACLVTWAALTWTLAAAGYWRGKVVHAHRSTRWAFTASGVSSFFILLAWTLDLGMFTRIAANAITVEGDQPSVKPGAAIIMNLFAFLLSLGGYITHLTWGRYQPRPAWTIKGHSDFNVDVDSGARQPPLSAALPPSDDLPPSWDSLNITDAREIVLDEKNKLQGLSHEDHLPSVEQRGFAV